MLRLLETSSNDTLGSDTSSAEGWDYTTTNNNKQQK